MSVLPNILPQAKLDLLLHLEYLALRSPNAGISFQNAVNNLLDQLLLFPQLGESYKPAGNSEAPVRFFTISGFSNYVLFYRDQESRIDIIRVLHGAQDWQLALFP